MPVAVFLQVMVDLLCAVHIYKTGRPRWWLAIVFMAPGLGAIAYLLFEVIPHAGGGRHVKRVIKHFDPGLDLRARLAEVERWQISSDTVLRDCVQGGPIIKN